MGKSKNTKERSRILKIAFDLFKTKGFVNTTYQDIADSANVQKTLVQYYFPKKEIFIEQLIEVCLNSISEIIKNSKVADEDNVLEKLYLIGYFQFLALIYNENMRYLKYDIISSRINTKTIIENVIVWVLKYMEIKDKDEISRISDAITFSMGGAFEYIFQFLMDSKEISPNYVSEKVIQIMNTLLGLPVINISIPDIMDEEWILDKVKQFDKMVFDS